MTLRCYVLCSLLFPQLGSGTAFAEVRLDLCVVGEESSSSRSIRPAKTGFEDKILAFYARGMTTRDIQAQVQDLYGVEISPTFISTITEAVMEEVQKTAESSAGFCLSHRLCGLTGTSRCGRTNAGESRALYLALGVDMEGQKELLGMWISQNEGAKFWLSVFTELQNRGVKDIFIACMDGLTGLPEAVETLYPHTRIQLCMVHMVRNSLKYVSYKHRKEVEASLKLICSAATEAEAQVYLDLFAEKWDPALFLHQQAVAHPTSVA
jgi:putative transposase